MAAQHLVLAEPVRVATLTLLATSAGGVGLTPPSAGALNDLAAASDSGAGSLDVVTQLPRLVSLLAQGRALFGHDTAARVASIDRPTLVISGSDDATLPLANARWLAASIPGARLLVVPDAGHAIVPAAAGAVTAEVRAHVLAHPVRASGRGN